MSDRLEQITKSKDGKSKYSTLNLFDKYKGKSLESQKSTVVSRYGLQSLGKVAPIRRMPPPAHLPSLKSEHRGLSPSVIIVPKDGSGWANKQETSSQKSSTVLTAQQQESQPQLLSQTSASSFPKPLLVGSQESTSSCGPKPWAPPNGKAEEHNGLRATNRMHPVSHEEFPTLQAAGEQDKVGKERSASDLSYGPGPSLRPQKVTSWRDGGGMNLQPSSLLLVAASEPEAKSVETTSQTILAACPVAPPSPQDFQDSLASSPCPTRSLHSGPPPTPVLFQQCNSSAVYHDMLPAFMCSRESCDSVKYRPTSKTPVKSSAAVIGVVKRGFTRGPLPSPGPVRCTRNRTSRPAIIKPENLKSLDDLDNDADGWAGIQEEVDYSEKLKFSDDEDNHSIEKNSKRGQEKNRRNHQVSVSSGEQSYTPDEAEEESGRHYLYSEPRGQFSSAEKTVRVQKDLVPQSTPLLTIPKQHKGSSSQKISLEEKDEAHSEGVEQSHLRHEEESKAHEEFIAACAEKFKSEKTQRSESVEDNSSRQLPLSPVEISSVYNKKEGAKEPTDSFLLQDNVEAGSSSNTRDDASEPKPSMVNNVKGQKAVSPRIEVEDQSCKGENWMPRSGTPVQSGDAQTQRGYCSPYVLDFDSGWMMLPPYMDPRMVPDGSSVDCYTPTVHSSGGMINPGMLSEHLHRPVSASGDGCPPSVLQERQATSSESGCHMGGSPSPLQSTTPPNQGLHESSEELVLRQSLYASRKEFANHTSENNSHIDYQSPWRSSLRKACSNETLLPKCPNQALKDSSYGKHFAEMLGQRSSDKDFEPDLWTESFSQPKRQEEDIQEYCSYAASNEHQLENNGKVLSRRTGSIKKPVLKALKIEDKENENPKVDLEKLGPYRLETEMLTNVHELKHDSSKSSLQPGDIDEEVWDGGKTQNLDIDENEKPLEQGHKRWVRIDGEQPFRGVCRGHINAFGEFHSGDSGMIARGGYNMCRTVPGTGQEVRQHEFAQSDDCSQRGKPRRRNVSETLSNCSECEELPKRRREKVAANGVVLSMDKEPWRSNKVYAEGLEGGDQVKTGRSFGRLLPPRLANAGYGRVFGSRETVNCRGRGGQYENGYRFSAESYSRRSVEQEPPVGLQRLSGTFLERHSEQTFAKGDYYCPDTPDNRTMRHRRPPRHDKPPRFRRLQQEKELGSHLKQSLYGDLSGTWTGTGEESGGRGHLEYLIYRDRHRKGSDIAEWREKGEWTTRSDATSEHSNGESGSAEKRDLSKRSFSSQRPMTDRQNRKGDLNGAVENSSISRVPDPVVVAAASKGGSWQSGISQSSKRSTDETSSRGSSSSVYKLQIPENDKSTISNSMVRKVEKDPKVEMLEALSIYEMSNNQYPESYTDAITKKQCHPLEEERRKNDQSPMVSSKNKTVISKMPPRFAKKQANMAPSEKVLSPNNLGTEIWEASSAALSVQSSVPDSWTKPISYPGGENDSEVFRGSQTDSGIDLSAESQGSSTSSSRRSSPYGILKPEEIHRAEPQQEGHHIIKETEAKHDQSKEHKPGPIGKERSMKHRKGSEGIDRLEGSVSPVNGVDVHVENIITVPPIEFGVSTKDSDFGLSPGSVSVTVSSPATMTSNAVLPQGVPVLRSHYSQPGINLNTISFPSTDLTLKMESARKAWENSQSLPAQSCPLGSGSQTSGSISSSTGVSYSSFSITPMPVASVAPSISMQAGHISPLYLDAHIFPGQPRFVAPPLTQQQSYPQAAAQQIPISLHTSLQAQAQMGLQGGLSVSQSQEMFSSIPPFRSQGYIHPNLSQTGAMVLSSGAPLKGPYSAFPSMQPSDMARSQSASHYQPMTGTQLLLYDGQLTQTPGLSTSQMMDSQLIQLTMPLSRPQLRYSSAQQHLILPQSIHLQQGQNLSMGGPRRMQPPLMTNCREQMPQMEMKGFQFAEKLIHSAGSYRPGSVSPGGKPSGTTAMTPLPPHYAQQIPHQGNMVMHMRPHNVPNPIQRPVMQINKPVIICSSYPSTVCNPPLSSSPANEDGMKNKSPMVSQPDACLGKEDLSGGLPATQQDPRTKPDLTRGSLEEGTAVYVTQTSPDRVSPPTALTDPSSAQTINKNCV